MSSPENFADRLIQNIKLKNSCVVVGLDPRLSEIPTNIQLSSTRKHGQTFNAAFKCILDFNKHVIDIVAMHAVAVKPQIAFYEQYGSFGIKALEKTVKYAKKCGLIVILDAKRNDIGSTAEAYSNGYLGRVPLFENNSVKSYDVDAITVNPYLGSDGISPFVRNSNIYGTGIFVLVRTSNPSAQEIQDIECETERLYKKVGRYVYLWGSGTEGYNNYRSVGAVVGATYPDEAKDLRELMPNSFFLVPGYGVQGASAEDIVHCFNKDGLGAIINSSRGIIFAYKDPHWKEQYGERNFEQAIESAVIKMKKEINLTRAKKTSVNS
jgi:orotidine-5'-phosphate decarboxylase